MSDWPTVKTDQATGKRYRVVTGARLHLGLLDIASPFGGIGLMVEDPATELVVTPSATWACRFAAADASDQALQEDAAQQEPTTQQELDARLRPIAAAVAKLAQLDRLPNCTLEVIRRPHAHCGLGSGTQLALAAADLMSRYVDLKPDWRTLAVDIAGRGKRSAVGIHGYFHGGLIYEDANEPCDINPIVQRVELPQQWSILIARPREDASLVSGDAERKQFATLAETAGQAKGQLQGIARDQLVPAAQAGEFDAFTESVARYNHASGMLFASVQGGPYHGSAVARLVDQLNRVGGRGVGQSSWGPGVFAWFRSLKEAQSASQAISETATTIAITRPQNAGTSCSA